MNKIIEFIRARFPSDSNWLDGNCFYFSTILKARFPEGVICYDVIAGHFIFKYKEQFYDWNGQYSSETSYIVEWEKFDEYDIRQKERIISGCIL